MTNNDLRNGAGLDLSAVELDYEGFRQLADNPNLSENERIGFPEKYRRGYTAAIMDDILAKVPRLANERGLTVADIGPGCSALPRELISLCYKQGHRLALIDSPEMLSQLPDIDGTTVKIPGAFPRNADAIAARFGKADAVICYSVLQYIFVDTNIYMFIDAVLDLLAPTGRVLLGDIPNASKRRRFFASDTGQRFHREFTGKDEDPLVTFNCPLPGKIDDSVIAGILMRAQVSGFDAYLLPQPASLPMSNRRDDLLIVSP